MYRKLIFLALCLGSSGAHALSTCPVTVAGLTLSATSPRTTGASPLTVFFDATATTSSVALAGANTVTQDVYFLWNFSDTAASGQGVWANGAKSAYSSKNTGTGIVQGHMYALADGAGNQTYTPIVTAVAMNADHTTTAATCSLAPVTVQDPAGVWPNAATTCQANGALPVAGSNGCPVGAAVLNSGTLTVGNLSNKRILYRCGDTFTNTSVTSSGTKGSLDRYGAGCTGSNNPVFLAGGTGMDGWLTITNPSTDIRMSNIVFDGNNISCPSSPCALIGNQLGGTINGGNKPVQYTFYNIDTKNYQTGIRWNAGGQMAIVASTTESVQPGTAGCGPANCAINVFVNNAGIGAWTTTGTPEDYTLIVGNLFFNALGSNNNTYEVFRDSLAIKQIITNNTMHDAGTSSGYAIIKLHNLCFATNGQNPDPWCVQSIFSQYIEMSDNFLFGSSGAQCLEIAPENAQSDERIRLTVIERNIFKCTESNGRQGLLSGVNITFRDNTLISAPGNGTTTNNAGVQVAQRGIEPAPTGVEIYNNTCSSLTPSPAGGLACVLMNTSGQAGPTPVTNSFVQNTLSFNASATVANTSGTNTISNNTSNANNSLNPGFANYTGSFSVISDFKPTANYSGGANVPVFTDALGVPWAPTWDLGGVHH